MLSYSNIRRNSSSAFFLPSKMWILSAINSEAKKIGDLCSVVTGFYSGNDGKYLRRAESVNRGKNKYSIVNVNDVCEDDFSSNPPLTGISGSSHWVPIVKGGSKRFYKPSEWYMDWGTDAINDYRVTNKKRARFQNSQFYFRQGIGVPMVSSLSITSSLIKGRLFDQSIVGVFPRDLSNNFVYYLLGFFNSTVCNELIRTINASANNSANYLKKLPLIIPSDTVRQQVIKEVKRLIDFANEREVKDNELGELNSLFNLIYSSATSL